MEELESRWQREAEAVLSGMQEWRLQHPRASLREIEAALDERLDCMRARLLHDLALASTAADLARQAEHDRPRCARCDVPLQPRGRHARTVVTHGDQPLHLERSYGVCPSCNDGLFPPG